jgi:hypothetical protein
MMGEPGMKKKILISFMLLLLILLSACSGQEYKELTRVDVQIVDEQGDYEEAEVITDVETMEILKKTFEKVKWDPSIQAEMARQEDVFVTLFYTFEEDMPERLYEYRIWFNGDDSATIISNNENEGYGYLDGADKLKNILMN